MIRAITPIYEKFLCLSRTHHRRSALDRTTNLRRRARRYTFAHGNQRVCLHGLGHALMYFTENQLDKSLQGCDSLPDGWSRESCYGGVFMENVFSSNPEIRNVSATDYHHPCNQIDAKYRGACYLMQTWRMEEMRLTTGKLFDECSKARPSETDCAQTIWLDLSNIAPARSNRTPAEK